MDPESGKLKKELPFKLEDILMGRKKEDSYSFFNTFCKKNGKDFHLVQEAKDRKENDTYVELER